MPYQPSCRLTTVLASLIPPAAREHVLGDLSEFADTRREYVTWFAAILPAVVFSETQRRLRAGTGVGLMAGLSALSLAVVALGTRGRALADGEWIQWVAPWMVWVTGCALAATYGKAGTRLWSGWGVLAALLASIGTAALAGAHAGAVAGALFVATVVHVAITLPRVAADLPRLAAAGPPLTLDNLQEQARTFQRHIWWRNARESAVAIALLVINGRAILTSPSDSPISWMSPALGAAGLVCVLFFLHVKAGSRRVPDADAVSVLQFHRAEIARQRDMLQWVPAWYLLPLVPGLVASTIAKWHPVKGPTALIVLAAVFYAIARLNGWGARWLDGKLAEADGLVTERRDRSAGS